MGLRSIIYLIFFPIALLWSTAAHESIPGLHFSSIYRNEKLFGISFKPVLNARDEFSQQRDEVEKQFEYWLAFKKGTLATEQQKAWIELCRSAPIHASSPFCPFYLKEAKSKAKELGLVEPPKFSDSSRLSPGVALHAWNSHQWSILAGRSEAEIRPILGQLQSIGAAREAAQKILKNPQCVSSALLFGIGLKLESAFPKPEYRSMTEAIYQLAFNCSQDAPAITAGYRLGLMKIWDGKPEEAEKIFAQMPDLPHSSEHQMRIGYWRYYCAHLNHDIQLKEKLRSWIAREYPLSFHSLLVHSSKFGSDLQWKEAKDPEIRFRPTSDPDLGASTAAIEYLLIKGETSAARNLLLKYQDAAIKEDPAFRLYWAILLKRAGISAESYRFMASAFRRNQKLISRPTLEILYPKQFIELVPEEQENLDPFFTLSIIRQESAFDPNVTSSAKAHGLMQLQLPTARNFDRHVTTQQLMDPRTNIRIGNRYMNALIRAQNGSLELALASYNAGPGRIRQWRSRYPISHPLLFIDLLPARETREYVSSILRNYFWYLKLYGPTNETDRAPAQELPPRQNFRVNAKIENYIRSMIPSP